MTVHGIVLCVSDLSTASDHALQRAATYAFHAGVGCVVCHVLPEVVGIRPLFPQLRVFDREAAQQLRQWATQALESQIDRALGPEDAKPALRVESGSPHSTVLEVAEEIHAGLIVISAVPSPHGSASGAALAERVARHAACPVLLAQPPRGKSVLAATDFSDPALPAVHAGLAEAERLKLPLYVLHSIDLDVTILAAAELGTPISPGALLTSYVPSVLDARRTQARALLDELSKQIGQGLSLLREGPPVDAILGAAESTDAALVVVGTHGRSGLTRLAMGSVAEGILRGARRSTLVVPLNRSVASTDRAPSS